MYPYTISRPPLLNGRPTRSTVSVFMVPSRFVTLTVPGLTSDVGPHTTHSPLFIFLYVVMLSSVFVMPPW